MNFLHPFGYVGVVSRWFGMSLDLLGSTFKKTSAYSFMTEGFFRVEETVAVAKFTAPTWFADPIGFQHEMPWSLTQLPVDS